MMNLNIKYIFFIVLFFYLGVISFAYADDKGYYDEHEKGWHWYDDPKKQEEDEEENSLNDPVIQMNAVRATIQRALDQAVLNPTQENVKKYKSIQDQLARQADKFSNVWKEMLLENPALDYSLLHPTNNMGRMIESDQERIKEENAIRALSRTYGLFFFYRSTCPYCRSFAPIVKTFAKTYGIKVTAITTDGISLPEFPNSYLDQGQAERFHVTVEPALFAVSPYTEKAFPITYGLISLSDLKRRILDIATKFGENEK